MKCHQGAVALIGPLPAQKFVPRLPAFRQGTRLARRHIVNLRRLQLLLFDQPHAQAFPV